jgi:uncharacterized protein (TIGR03663 family)
MKWLDGTSADRRLTPICLMILLVALVAVAVRAPRLRMRPMHTDEAVHADKFRLLLDNGRYEYNPREYHGPTLNYLTLIPAWLSGAADYAHIDEVTIRIVPVAFGVILVLLTILIADGLGWAAVVAAVLTALSPAMVFYSRYYIQEMLLVCFTLAVIACGYRYARTHSPFWAIAAGVSAGLMHATKETTIIAFGAMLLALIVSHRWSSSHGVASSSAAWRWSHVALGLAAAMGVSALFYSSFLSHPRGILDSYLTYATYFGRAGQTSVHVHPWYYYLQILLLSRYNGGPIWSEAGIVLLALVGLVTPVRASRASPMDIRLVRFLAVYTVAMTVIYSAIPYKTPWCLLSFLHGMILLAGVGAVTLLAWLRRPALRAGAAVLLIAVVGHLAFQTYRANFVYYADSRNPYVYAHPTPEVFTAVEKVREYVGIDGLGRSDQTPIQVIVPDRDYWPLPWYLRDLRVGYYADVPPAHEIGPLILISDKLELALSHRLYQETPPQSRRMYMYLFDAPYYIWFRPGVKLTGFVRRDLWEQREAQTSPPPELRGGNDGR